MTRNSCATNHIYIIYNSDIVYNAICVFKTPIIFSLIYEDNCKTMAQDDHQSQVPSRVWSFQNHYKKHVEEYFFLANKVLQSPGQPSDSGETVRVAFQQLGDHCSLNMSCLMLLRECMSSQQGQSNGC